MRVNELKNYKFSNELMMRNLGETIMVYNPENGDMYEMNDITAMLIDYLIKGYTGEEILDKICTDYEVETITAIEDISPLLDRLIEIGLLKVEE